MRLGDLNSLAGKQNEANIQKKDRKTIEVQWCHSSWNIWLDNKRQISELFL